MKRERDKRELRSQFEEDEEEHHHLPLLVVQLPHGSEVLLPKTCELYTKKNK